MIKQRVACSLVFHFEVIKSSLRAGGVRNFSDKCKFWVSDPI